MKIILKVYEYKETQEKEFPSPEEANRLVKKMIEDNPNLLVEAYLDMEIDANCVTDLSDVEEYGIAADGTKAIAA
jgi:hypothetical protein